MVRKNAKDGTVDLNEPRARCAGTGLGIVQWRKRTMPFAVPAAMASIASQQQIASMPNVLPNMNDAHDVGGPPNLQMHGGVEPPLPRTRL